MRTKLVLATVTLGIATQGAAQAEETYRCNFVSTCDQNGVCVAAEPRNITFNFQPVEIERHGSGEYVLRYDAQSFEMTRDGEMNQMVWVDGEANLQVLNIMEPPDKIGILGTTAMVWHQMGLLAGMVAPVHFLKCERLN
jgi:hypothetical protein